MRPRNITITPVLNGFVVNVGCQAVVFDTPAKLGSAITEYYSNPGEVERRYVKDKVNSTLDQDRPAPVAAWDEALIRPHAHVSEPRPYRTEECVPPVCSPSR